MEQPARLTRRNVIQVGGAALLSKILGFSDKVGAAQQEQHEKYRKLFYFFQDGGGPSNLDGFDPKPRSGKVDAPFDSIQTSVPGVRVSELFPEVAKRMHKVTLLRAREASNMSHDKAIASALRRDVNDGSNLLSKISHQATGMPFGYAQTPHVIGGLSNSLYDYRHMSYSVQLSLEMCWNEEENRYDFPTLLGSVDSERLTARRRLSVTLDRVSRFDPDCRVAKQFSEHYGTAFDLYHEFSDASLRINRDDATHYTESGQTPHATSLGILSARELLRKKIVGAVMLRNGFSCDYGGWDHHANLADRTGIMAPRLDAALAALIDDVTGGTFADDTVVVVDTEFGRKARMNPDAGRDHDWWHTSMLFGGEFGKGIVLGETDAYVTGKSGIVSDANFADVILEGLEKKSRKDQGLRDAFPVFS